MKKSQLCMVICLIMLGLLASCGSSSERNTSSDTLGGESVDMNTVGNTFDTSVAVNSTAISTGLSATVTNNSDATVTLQVTADLSNPSLSTLAGLIPSTYKDGSGDLSTQITIKNTSEGILDYMNRDDAPFVVVRYDAEVGDRYTLTKSNGAVITRTVTAKSSTDDYYWQGMYIKTITVEQDSRISGIDRIIYNANHRFGLVGIEFVLDDGTSTRVVLSSNL